MSFKFKLGDIVVPTGANSALAARVDALHLNGFMRVLRLETNTSYMVRDKDYEKLVNKSPLSFVEQDTDEVFGY